jgi:pimeloyl-ACP methyl ester carboxylesterase
VLCVEITKTRTSYEMILSKSVINNQSILSLIPGFLILLTLSLCCSITVSQVQKVDPDCDYNITQLIESKGYPCEEHKVTTKDGYILGVFRIPHGRNSSKLGRPVLLQHGLLDAATTWVLNFPDQSLAFILADIGYDVWLGNIRGNRYSRAHVKYNPDHDEAFWDFSWDDMARDDLPSMVYYILNATQHTQIGYVGHSQGTLMAFAEFGNLSNAVQNNISFYAALAPIAQVGHQKTPLKYLDTDSKELERYWHQLFGRNEFLPASNILTWLGKYACGEFFIDRLMCENMLFIVGGPDTKNLNISRIPVYVSHGPSGTSVKNMVHFMQCGRSDRFEAYDYGSPDKNQLHYNQTTPPIYSIRSMKVPTAVFWAGEDWLADPVDVTYIFDNIQSLVYEKYIPNYNHFDFVWAKTANEIIYQDLINIMQKYHPIQ